MSTVAVVVPELGSEQSPLSVSCWLVDVGDHVEEGDRLVELLSPGILFDVAAPAAGRLTQIVKPFESHVAVGDVLGWIESDGDG